MGETLGRKKGSLKNRVDYYPFGLTFNSSQRENATVNRFLFNGKEMQGELGINWLDYGSRMRDPALGRFFNVDPHAENYFGWTSYNFVANNPARLVDPDGKDWYEDKDGNIMWNVSRDKILKYNDLEWKNIGSKITIRVQSYIHEDNDIPIPGVEGVKLETTFSLEGNYDEKGKFTGFSTEHEKNVGFTFGIIAGDEGVKGAAESVTPMTEVQNGNWAGGFEHHTQVGTLEKPGMYGMFGSLVDVTQKVNVTVNSTGQLNIEIGHGTFPSVRMQLDQAQDYQIYDFRQYSFINTHSSGITNQIMGGDGVLYQAISNRVNIQNRSTNNSYVKFTGFNAGTGIK